MTTDHTREARHDRRTGFTDDDDAIARIMMARWADPDVEGNPVGASKVASFADMARAVRESPWLAAHVAAAARSRDAEIEEWEGLAAQAREDRDLFEQQRDEARAALAGERERIGAAIGNLKSTTVGGNPFGDAYATGFNTARRLAARIARLTTDGGSES